MKIIPEVIEIAKRQVNDFVSELDAETIAELQKDTEFLDKLALGISYRLLPIKDNRGVAELLYENPSFAIDTPEKIRFKVRPGAEGEPGTESAVLILSNAIEYVAKYVKLYLQEAINKANQDAKKV